jgi:hypothetical protein
MGLPVPGMISGCLVFISISLSERGDSLKALTRESDITRYLPSLMEEMAYITTKNANSRVMKSA